VRAQEVLEAERAQLIRRPVEPLVVESEEVRASDQRVQGCLTHDPAGVLRGVDDSCVPAAGEDDEPALGVEHERLVLGDGVLHRPVRPAHQAAPAPVALRVDARHGAREPDSRPDRRRSFVLEEGCAGRFVLRAQLQHRVALAAAVFSGPGPENAATDVGSAQALWLCPLQLPAHRRPRCGRYVVAQYHLADARVSSPSRAPSIRAAPRIEEQLASASTSAVPHSRCQSHEHGRQHHDAQRAYAGGRGGGALRQGRQGRAQEQEAE
jgi:hypothetical protein